MTERELPQGVMIGGVEYLTKKAVCEWAQISNPTIEQRVKSGVLRASKQPNGRLLFKPEDVIDAARRGVFQKYIVG